MTFSLIDGSMILGSQTVIALPLCFRHKKKPLLSPAAFPSWSEVDRLSLKRGQAMPTLERKFGRLLLVGLICVTSFTLKAQVTTGTFLGTVYDATNAAVPGASITATNLQTGVSRSVVSAVTGEYLINLLPVGNYSLRVEHAGFKTEQRSSVEIQINSRVRLDFVLQVGSVSEEIKVAGSTPLLDTDTAESGEVIENQRVTQLPLNGRQFVQLALLTAGVVPEVKGTLSSPLALSGQSANANGTRFEDNVFLLDGVSIRDEIYT